MSGTALRYPGFCFNRITDFLCYMWVPDQLPQLSDTGPVPGDSNFNDYNIIDERGGLDGIPDWSDGGYYQLSPPQ